MAKVTIGNKDYVVRELNFIAIEKTWATIQLTMSVADPIQAVGAALEIIGAALQEEPEFKPEDFGIPADRVLEPNEIDALVSQYLKRQLRAGQIGGVQVALDEIIEEAGLRPEAGELTKALTAVNRGTETPDPSSPSSSPAESKEEAGTA